MMMCIDRNRIDIPLRDSTTQNMFQNAWTLLHAIREVMGGFIEGTHGNIGNDKSVATGPITSQ